MINDKINDMKLELKHLAPFLSYDLPFMDLYDNSIRIMRGINLNHAGQIKGSLIGKELCVARSLYEIKPILHDLSDLTKEIEVNGEKFVPADKIFKGWKTDKDMRLWWYETELKLSSGNIELIEYGIIQQLIEYHFNVFDLPPHLWIDINTLNK